MDSQINQINTLISQATDSILCNSDCKKNRESERLKEKYLNAQTNLLTAPNQVEISQKNYITFTEGESAYIELQEQQLQEKAEIISDTFIEKCNEESIKINTQIDSYSGLLLNFKNVLDLFKKYKIENIELLKELKEETNDILTNERKTYYQNQHIDTLKIYYYYILFIMYIICVVCFVVFFFIYKDKHKFKWFIYLFIFIFLIILPFISYWIILFILYLFSLLYKLFVPTKL
jgi:hypothetical protein